MAGMEGFLMVKRTRCAHSGTLKAKAALVALRADKTLVELAKQYELHPNQITEWKPLHAKIGQQALEMDFLAGALDQAGWSSAKG